MSAPRRAPALFTRAQNSSPASNRNQPHPHPVIASCVQEDWTASKMRSFKLKLAAAAVFLCFVQFVSWSCKKKPAENWQVYYCSWRRWRAPTRSKCARRLTGTSTARIPGDTAARVTPGATVCLGGAEQAANATTASISACAATGRDRIITRTIARWGAGEPAWSTAIMTTSPFLPGWAVSPTPWVSLEAPGL